jgi:hypothetical protein
VDHLGQKRLWMMFPNKDRIVFLQVPVEHRPHSVDSVSVGALDRISGVNRRYRQLLRMAFRGNWQAGNDPAFRLQGPVLFGPLTCHAFPPARSQNFSDRTMETMRR